MLIEDLRADVCGIDPGETTGVFAVSVSTLDGRTGVRSDFTSYELDRRKAFTAVQLEIAKHPGVVIACERYVITERTARLTQQPAALEFIGVLKQLCFERQVRFVMQMKSDASRLARDTVLKRIGWYQRGQDHANDAARHALLRLASERPIVFQTLMTTGSIASTGH